MAKIKPIRINIVEEDGWKDWDYSQIQGISQWSADNAWDDWMNMEERTCQRYVDDLVTASMSKAERKKVTHDDLARICETIAEDQVDSFESIRQPILDAHTWAWEVAYTPDDRDIEKALERAKRNWDMDFSVAKYWELVLEDELEEGPREWSPRGRWTQNKLYKDFMDRIQYERKRDHYDRFMVFDWGDSGAVKLLLQALKKNPDEGNLSDVESELRDWADSFMGTFFKELQDRMQDTDPSYKWDLDPHWKSMLKDKHVLAAAREEILEFLAKPKKEEVE